MQAQRALENHENIPFITVNLRANTESVNAAEGKKKGLTLVIQLAGEYCSQGKGFFFRGLQHYSQKHEKKIADIINKIVIGKRIV